MWDLGFSFQGLVRVFIHGFGVLFGGLVVGPGTYGR